MQSPLADRLRPRTLAEVCGQQHLLGPGRVFRKAIESGRVPNMIFYGPSGVGKTTVARIIAENSGMRLHKLNGTSAGTGDIKAVMAEIGTFQSRNGLLLYLDEIQYLNKKQQQSLLECMEDGTVTLIASTTENPYFYIYNALLSRATVFEFKPLTPEDVRRGLENALVGLGGEAAHCHKPLPGIHQPGLPGAVRGRLHLRHGDGVARGGEGERAGNRGVRLRKRRNPRRPATGAHRKAGGGGRHRPLRAVCCRPAEQARSQGDHV